MVSVECNLYGVKMVSKLHVMVFADLKDSEFTAALYSDINIYIYCGSGVNETSQGEKLSI